MVSLKKFGRLREILLTNASAVISDVTPTVFKTSPVSDDGTCSVPSSETGESVSKDGTKKSWDQSGPDL